MGTQIAAYIFPLATVPYLARVLGPLHWGIVAFSQALGLYLSMVVDFGFQLSASRKIARVRDIDEEVENVVAGVLGAKLILAFICIVAVFVLQHNSHSFQRDSVILWGGAISGVSQGFSMIWFYQGFERMKSPAVTEVAGRAIVCMGIFVFVREPGDAWVVLALQCIGYFGIAAFQTVSAYRQVRFRWPTRSATWQAVTDSAPMFLFRSSISLYTTANALILGALSTPIAVGYYSGAERLIKALAGLMNPVSQSLYPRVSRLVLTDARKAIRLTRMSLGLMILAASLLAVGAAVSAPFVIHLILGPGYEQAIPVLRVLSLLLPAIAASTVLGIQWMLPLGMDRAYNTIVIAAGVVNVSLAVCWVSRWQQMGMAWAVVVTEYLVIAAICIVLAHRKMTPLSNSESLPSRVEQEFATVAGVR